MEWIDVKTDLPKKYQEVLVWIKYEHDSEFSWTNSWIEDEKTKEKSSFSYKEPITGKYWAVGSAKNYEITHFMEIRSPKEGE